MLDIFIFFLAVFVFYKLYSALGTHSPIEPKKLLSPSFKKSSAELTALVTKKVISPSGLALPKNFDEHHFMEGALSAYQLIIRCFFEKNMFPCASFLSDTVKQTFENSFSPHLQLKQQEITQFSLINITVKSNKTEAYVSSKSELIVHDIEKNCFETVLLNHRIGFLNPRKSSPFQWICTSIEQD